VNETVDVREESGRVVIEPVRQKIYDVNELVKAITVKNRHESVDFGAAIGKEVDGC
jgi:antitoxin MazE